MGRSYPYFRTESRIEESSKKKGKSPQLFLERFLSIIPAPYYWEWTIFAGIIFLSTSVVLLYFEKSISYILSFFILSIMIAQQPIIVIWTHKKMKLFSDYLLGIIELPESKILKWHEDQMAIVFDEKRMITLGVLYSIFSYFVDIDQFGFTFKSSYSQSAFEIDYFLVHFLTGVGLYVLLCTALMVYRIGKLPMNINVLLSKNLQIKGSLYSKFTICATSVYAISGCFSLSTPSKLNTLLKIGVYSFFAVLLLAYFILPQYSIHQMIMKTKKEKLEMFSKRLMAKAEEAFSKPTKDNISCLRNFLDIENQLDQMCVWPFGSYEILHIVLIVIIPFMVVLLEIVFDIIK
jgi:hypothetical protein